MALRGRWGAAAKGVSSVKPPVLMAVLNDRDGTLRTIRSLGLHRTFILFDNGSPPGTLDFASTLPDCTVIRAPRNMGVARAWNALFDEAFRRGADAAFCTNNDVVYLPNAYDALLEVVQEHAEVGVISMSELPGDLHLFRERTEIASCRFSMFLIRKSTWDRVGKFDTRFRPAYWEDLDYSVRLAAAGIPALQTVRAGGFHSHFASTRSFYGRVFRAYTFNKNRWLFVVKHGWHMLAPTQRRIF